MAVISLEGYKPSPRYDGKNWQAARIEGAATETGPWTTVELFVFVPPDADPTDPVERNFTTELVTTETWLRVVFIDGTGDEENTLPVALAPTEFATRRDVAARLGRELTEDEEGQVDYLLQANTDLLSVVTDWAAAEQTVVPPVLRRLCVELVARTLVVPFGVSGTREQIGAYSYSQNFQGGGAGTAATLSKDEVLIARRAVWGTNSGSAVVKSIADDVLTLNGDGP